MHRSRAKPPNLAVQSTAARASRQPRTVSDNEKSRARKISADTAKLIAAEYCLFHYPTLYTAGTPRLSAEQDTPVWVVPIVLASPTRGLMGEVGELHIDAVGKKIVASTERAAVV